MKKWKKSLVYRSKDKSDWETAKSLLTEAGIEIFPFAAEESPMPGCGGKVDPRKFLNKNPIPSTVYRIEVLTEADETAKGILAGNVQPVRSDGYSI